MKKTIRFLSLLMVLVLCVSLAPVSAIASEEPEEIIDTEDAPDIMEPVEEVEEPEETEEPEEIISGDEALVPVGEIKDTDVEAIETKLEYIQEAEETEIIETDGASNGIHTGNRDWKWPVPSSSSISSCFEDPPRTHGAIDIVASSGSSVYAAYAGTIIYTYNGCTHNYAKDPNCACPCGACGDLGNAVYILHDYQGVKFVSRYGHLTSVNVSVGQTVSTSTVIGTVGSTGRSSGAHLDFRIAVGSTAGSATYANSIDPLLDQFLELPSGFNANGASTSCCYTYANQVINLYSTAQDNTPTAVLDIAEGGTGSIRIRGWAFDKDITSKQVVIHVYSNGTCIYAGLADTYRDDVNAAYGCGNYHGFDVTFKTDLSGNVPITIYVLNYDKNGNYDASKNLTLCSNRNVTVKKSVSINYYGTDGKAWKIETATTDQFTLSASYPTKSGSYFCGWSYTSGSSNIDARPGDTITVSSDVNLYPVYVSHEKAISGEAVPIYNISDFSASGYNITAADVTTTTYKDTSHWSDWSNYTTEAISASDTVQVRTTAMYRYYYYLCPYCGAHEPFWGTSDCGQQIPSSSCAVTWSTVPYSQSNYAGFSYTTSKYYTYSLGDGQLWIFSSGNVNATAVGTVDADSSAVVITTGYSSRKWIEEKKESSKTVSGYKITAAKTYTVTFDANSGTGAPSAQTKTHDVALTLSSTKPTRTGYTFQGWATTKTATTASYSAGGSYKNNASVTLYAVWKQNTPTTSATITTSSATSAPGGTVTVTVSVSNNPGMMYLSVTPVYDKNVLTLESVTNGTVFPTEPTKDTNYTWDESANVIGNGTLFTYTFKVKTTAAEGSYTVGVTLRECVNAAEQSVGLTINNGKVTVSKCVYGDATGDGSVNGLDLVRVRKYLAAYNYDTKTSTVTVSAGADATGDGSINGLDLVRLRKYLAAYNYDTNTSSVVLGPTK